MNKSLSFSCIVITLLLFSIDLQAQWKQLNVGSAAKINAVSVIGSYVFAGTDAGIYRSTDNGASWKIVSSCFTVCFAASGSNIFAGTSSGVIASIDGGESWSPPSSDLPYYITSLVVMGSNIFAGTYQNGVFRSSDNGGSWISVNNGLGAFQNLVTSLAFGGKTIFAGTAAGLCLSMDDGNSWSTLVANNLSSLQMINCISVNGSTIFVGTPSGILRSLDSDTTWEIDNNGLNNGTSIFSISVAETNIFIGTVNGIYKSSDNGANWSALNNGLPTSPSQVYSVATSDSILFAATNVGVYLSSNSGTSWATANSGIVGGQSSYSFLTGNGPNMFAVINENAGAHTLLYISTDYGATWSANTGLQSYYIQSITVSDSEAFAATDHGIYASSNEGGTWNAINGSVMDTTYPLYIVQSNSNIIVATAKGLYVSSDNGSNWKATGSNLPPALLCLAASGSNIFAGFLHAGVYVSSDHGANWTVGNDTLDGILSFASIGSTIFADRSHWTSSSQDTFPSYQGGVFRSTDDGKSWVALTSGLPENPLAGQLAVHGTNVFIDIAEDGFYCSKDNGNSWNKIAGSTDLSSSAGSLFVNDSSIFVGTYGKGIWSLPLSAITSVKQQTFTVMPTTFSLQQNYPNPFNPSTTIGYDIPKQSNVMLNVYDILGRKVETLVDAERSPGHYQLKFNASRLSSGVYFYRLQTDAFVQIKKLIVIK